MNNNVLLEDYKDVAKTISELKIKNKTFLITGSTGTLGSYLINCLLKSNKINNSKIKIIAISRNKNKAEKLFSNKSIVFKSYDDSINEKIDYLIHFACPTQSQYFVEHPYETINTIYGLTTKYLEIAHKKHARFIYISSMEVYGEIKDRKKKEEHELGQLCLESPRSSYPLGKRLAEGLCHYSYVEYKTDVVIARLAQTFGAGSNINDTRLYSYAAKCALENKDMILSTNGQSYGNYIYLSDAIKAILLIVIKGKQNETYNVVATNSNIKIVDFCKIFLQNINRVKINIGTNYFPNNTLLNMSSKKLQNLGWKNKYTLKQAVKKYMEYLK